MDPTRIFSIVALISLPTVMYGGYSLLRILRAKKLSPEQLTFFRAGHAHAGVLLVLSLIYCQILKQTRLDPMAVQGACIILGISLLAIPGGFFMQLKPAKPNRIPPGMWVTLGGAILLTFALLFLAYGLIIT